MRLLDFVAHDGGEFETDETEADHAEGIQDEAGIWRDAKIRSGHRGAKARPDNDSQTDENSSCDEGSDGAEVVEPLPYSESNDVEDGEKSEQEGRGDHGKVLAVGESGVARTQRENGDADEIEHHRRHVEHVVGPVAPAGEETVEVAENFFGPEIDATLAGITVGQFDDRDALRPEEEEQRNDPEPDSDATVGGDRGHDVEIEYGDDEEEDEIKAAEDAFEVRLVGLVGVRRGVLQVSKFQSFKVSEFRIPRFSQSARNSVGHPLRRCKVAKCPTTAGPSTTRAGSRVTRSAPLRMTNQC